MNEIERLIDKLNGIYPVSLPFRIAIRPIIKRKSFNNLALLIQAGTLADKAWQLLNGYVVVAKTMPDGTTAVKNIYYPGDIVTDIDSFFFNRLATCDFYAVGDIDVLELLNFEKLNFPETRELANRIIAGEKDEAIKRGDLIAIPNALERVKSFLQAKPAIGLPSEYAASFLALDEDIYIGSKYKLIEQAIPFAEQKVHWQTPSEDLAYRCKQLLRSRFTSKDIGTMAQIASECNSTLRTMNRATEKAFGLTAHQLLTEFRMQHAIQLLRNKVLVQHVAISVGYADQATFSKCFKKRFNFCPKEIKNNPIDINDFVKIFT